MAEVATGSTATGTVLTGMGVGCCTVAGGEVCAAGRAIGCGVTATGWETAGDAGCAVTPAA